MIIRIKVWHDTNLGRLEYPSGYYDEYLFNSEIREEPATVEKEVDNIDGRQDTLNSVATMNKSLLLYVEEPLYPYIAIIPMYDHFEIYDEEHDISYNDIYNISITNEESYNNGTVKQIRLSFSYDNFITRNSV
jgi:hypothetical protein